MTEIILSSINTIKDLAMFQKLYEGGSRTLNVSKLSSELQKIVTVKKTN